MKKKISLKRLELKVSKINDLRAKKITGGASHLTCFCDYTNDRECFTDKCPTCSK